MSGSIIENGQTVILNAELGVIRVDSPVALGNQALVTVQSFGENGAQGRFMSSREELIVFFERALENLKKGEL